MRLITIASLLLLTVACRKEVAAPAPAPPSTATNAATSTTTAPPTAVEGDKKYAIDFAQPDLLKSFVVGGRKGAATVAATSVKRGETVGFDVALKSAPDGLAATVEVVGKDAEPIFSERKLVPKDALNVSFSWTDAKVKPGSYTVRLMLGGDQYAEQPLEISE